MLALWRRSIQRALPQFLAGSMPPRLSAAALSQCRHISQEARKYRSPNPMAGWARRFPRPKGVNHTQEWDWRRRLVKGKKQSRRSFCPYTIKARRVFSRIRFQDQQSRLEMAARKEKEEGEGKGEEEATRAMDQKDHFSRHSGNVSSSSTSSRMDGYSRFGRNELVVPPSPVTPPDSQHSYCKPVVKRIDSWRAPWTKPFKRPRQEYQVGRPRPLTKAAARAVKNDREAAKAKRRLTKSKRLARGKIVNPKQRMEFT